MKFFDFCCEFALLKYIVAVVYRSPFTHECDILIDQKKKKLEKIA